MTDPPRWRGVNHLALVTSDMDATVRFYHGVLGMRLVASVMAGPMRHYFFEIGPENTLAFFEVKDAETFMAPAGIPDRLRKAQFDHLSFNLPDEQALVDLQARLKAAGCGVTDVVDHGFVRSIYFNDPNGIAPEASWWAIDATGRTADYGDTRLFADPDPVAAVHELATSGQLDWTPQTQLMEDSLADPV
ncbi:MAG TPA: VOC family protein [Acidimicrobiales bacterium]|jgi:catechol 2,3-dioxygenase-like lactoylglutathione lyase family enzyme|nr:VOC family protein [Acidimicrobiales bacterium]